MKAPLWLKVIVFLWIPTTFGVLWFAVSQDIKPYISEGFEEYSDENWVLDSWSNWLSTEGPVVKGASGRSLVGKELADSQESPQLTAWHIFAEGCSCNNRVEKHLTALTDKISNIKINRVQAKDIEKDVPATPTLLITQGKRIIYYGAYGSGLMCQNDGLTEFVSQAYQKTSIQPLVNTMLNGCFCTNSKRNLDHDGQV